MIIKLPESQASTIRPVADRARELAQALEQQRVLLTYMAAMVEPKVLDSSSGVGFDADNLAFIYPDPEPPEEE